MHRIFREIDVDDDRVIRFSEYRRAVQKNPELVDWFSMLNSAKVTNATEFKGSRTGSRINTEPEEDPNVIKIEREKAEQLVKIKTKNLEAKKQKSELKMQMREMSNNTENQL